MLSKEELKSQVKRGSDLLNEKMPGWYNKVDIRDIDMLAWNKCILGQIYGDYSHGIKILLGREPKYGTSAEDASYGFRCDFDDRADITRIWVNVILKLKEEQFKSCTTTCNKVEDNKVKDIKISVEKASLKQKANHWPARTLFMLNDKLYVRTSNTGMYNCINLSTCHGEYHNDEVENLGLLKVEV